MRDCLSGDPSKDAGNALTNCSVVKWNLAGGFGVVEARGTGVKAAVVGGGVGSAVCVVQPASARHPASASQRVITAPPPGIMSCLMQPTQERFGK